MAGLLLRKRKMKETDKRKGDTVRMLGVVVMKLKK